MGLLSILIAGCGGNSVTDAPKLGKVSGKITLDGAALSGATVVFTPSDNRTAMGSTDGDGKYELTQGPNVGAVVGENSVKITLVPKMEHDQSGAAKVDPSAVVIPPIYNTATTLKADVKPGDNTFNFDLKSK